MSFPTQQFYRILSDFLILVAAFGSSFGNLHSLSINLDDDHISSGRTNKIHFRATIHEDWITQSTCRPWDLYAWLSPSDVTKHTGMKEFLTIGLPAQVFTWKQRYHEFEANSAMVFDNVTYEADLNGVDCENVNFMCARFNSGRGDDVNCTSSRSTSTCIAINCKAVVMVHGVTVETVDNFSIDDPKDILINVTINYNLNSGTDRIPSMPNLWKLRVWLGAFTNGSHPRLSVIEQTLTEVQSKQELVSGVQFGFWNVVYSPNAQDLKNALCKDVLFICARFLLGNPSNSGVKMESSRGAMRTNCTRISSCATNTITTALPMLTTNLPTTTTSLPMPLTTNILPTSTVQPKATNPLQTDKLLSPSFLPAVTTGHLSTSTNMPAAVPKTSLPSTRSPGMTAKTPLLTNIPTRLEPNSSLLTDTPISMVPKTPLPTNTPTGLVPETSLPTNTPVDLLPKKTSLPTYLPTRLVPKTSLPTNAPTEYVSSETSLPTNTPTELVSSETSLPTNAPTELVSSETSLPTNAPTELVSSETSLSANATQVKTTIGMHVTSLPAVEYDGTASALSALPTESTIQVSSHNKETKTITTREVTTKLASNLENLSQIEVNNDNVKIVAHNLVALTTEELPDSINQLEAISATLQNIAEIESVSEEIVELSLTTVDNILESDNHVLQHSNQGSAIVTSLQKILANLPMDPNGDSFNTALTNIALVALSMRSEDAVNGITFNVRQCVNEPVNVTWSFDENIDVDDDGDDTTTAWLTLQGEMFQQTSDINNIRTNIIVYQNDKLFQATTQTNQSETASCPGVPSNVIGAELLVNGYQVTQLGDHAVKMVFNTGERNMTWQPSCEFWDFADAGNSGNWSSNGCHVVQDTGDQVTCQCNHLTNFAVLMSPKYGCYGNPYFLDVLSKIGCVISIISLFLTFLTYTLYKNLMGRTPQLILIQWTLSLICLYTVFLFGIDWSYNSTLCTVVATLLHYFTLTSVFWMGSEAASLFLVFVKGVTIVPRPQKFLPVAATLAWGLPVVIVLTSFFVIGEEDYRHTDFCYLRRGAHFYLGLLLPIGLVLLSNIVVFILVLKAITCRRSGSMLAKSQSTDGTRMIQQVLCIAVLVGITWVFGLLAIGGAAGVFNVLFCIFNTLQGLAVFLLFCVRRREVREAWRGTFSCGRHKQTYQLSQPRSRSGTASSRTDLYNINNAGGYRSRSGTVCSRTDGLSFNGSVAFDKV